MGSDGKDEKPKDISLVDGVKTFVVPDELDLDKNPIKYGTHEPGVTTTEAHDKDYMELVLRSGKHSVTAQKLMRQKIELRAKEFPRWPGEASGGVRAIWIESRFWYDRERLGPDFDPDWRSYRARYLKSLELDPREPVNVPEYEREMLNPIRRLYMKPGDFLENQIFRRISDDKWQTAAWRVTVTRLFMLYVASCASYYWIRYNRKKWETDTGAILTISRPLAYPGDPKFPFKDWKTEPADHDTTGFPFRTAYRDLRDFVDTTEVL